MFFRHALRLVEILTLLFPDSTQIAISAAQHFRLRSDSPYGHKRMTSSGTTIRFGLSKPGRVAEVASVGGFVKQCSVIIDPTRMRSLGISLQKVRDVIRDSTHGRGRPHSRTWRARVHGARPRLYQRLPLSGTEGAAVHFDDDLLMVCRADVCAVLEDHVAEHMCGSRSYAIGALIRRSEGR